MGVLGGGADPQSSAKEAFLSGRFGVWRDALGLLAEAGKGLAILVSVLTLAEALLGLAVLWIIKSLVQTLNTEGLEGAFSWQLSLIVAAIVLLGMISVWAAYLRVRQGLVVAEVVDRHIHTKAVSVDYGFYESPAYFNSLERARQAGSQRPTQMINSALLLLKSGAFLIGTGALLASIDWRIVPALLISVLAILVVRLRFTRALFDLKRQRAEMERRASYTDQLITADWHAKELRLGSMGAELLSQYRQTRAQIKNEQLVLEHSKAWAELLVSLLGACVFAGAIMLFISETTSSSEAVGNLVLFLLLFRRAETSGREMVQSLTKLYDDRLFLKQLFDFLNTSPREPIPARPTALTDSIENGIRFEGVSFAYPNSSSQVLQGIDMVLPARKVVALVGENGTGKTTLIKLLTRLYDPDSGRITLDGRDILGFDPDAYRRRFSVVFQNFSSYAMTVRQNVAAADIAGLQDDDRIMDALDRAGATEILTGLPRGLDTPLTRAFEGGQELSIGQWQRLALARAFFRPSDFLILDEPSSSLDPRAEFELFDELRDRAGDRAILLISHRLSTVRMADHTYVLDRGRVVQEGTHEVLARSGGRYAEMFELQARKYR